jgi:hypothetical protein
MLRHEMFFAEGVRKADLIMYLIFQNFKSCLEPGSLKKSQVQKEPT